MRPIAFFKKPLSEKEYVKRGDNCCPFCGFDQVEGGGVDVNEDEASQEVTCQRCLASWYDEYKLTGYTVINEPEAVEEDDE